MQINSNIHQNKKLYLPKNLRSFIVSNWKCSISPCRLNRWKVKLTRLFPKNKMKILIHWKPWNQWLFHKKSIISNKLVTKITQVNFFIPSHDILHQFINIYILLHDKFALAVSSNQWFCLFYHIHQLSNGNWSEENVTEH